MGIGHHPFRQDEAWVGRGSQDDFGLGKGLLGTRADAAVTRLDQGDAEQLVPLGIKRQVVEQGDGGTIGVEFARSVGSGVPTFEDIAFSLEGIVLQGGGLKLVHRLVDHCTLAAVLVKVNDVGLRGVYPFIKLNGLLVAVGRRLEIAETVLPRSVIEPHHRSIGNHLHAAGLIGERVHDRGIAKIQSVVARCAGDVFPVILTAIDFNGIAARHRRYGDGYKVGIFNGIVCNGFRRITVDSIHSCPHKTRSAV